MAWRWGQTIRNNIMEEKQIVDIVAAQHIYFNSRATMAYRFRVDALKRLKKAVQVYEKKFIGALNRDLGKSEFEAYATEVGFVLHDIGMTVKQLKKWMRPRRVRTSYLVQPASSQIMPSPLGVNLIISPFNYPMQLLFAPLTAAIAAGNTAVLKTSELTPAVSRVAEDLIRETFDPRYIAYVPGEVPETTILLKQKFHHIFFTGSPRVGSIVMAAAAKHLTPVTLELGGKSPCIVHRDARLDISVNRIAYGKFMNAGQTCIAPDYCLVHRDIADEFIGRIKKRILSLYGTDPSRSPDFGRIVNAGHFHRILSLIDPAKVVTGGESNETGCYIAPTLMKDVTLDDAVMSEEIFGPVLPVMTYDNIDEIFDIVSKLPQHPLACYLFTEDRALQKQIMSGIQFGGGCINHCIQHIVTPHLPFGGVGQSGMGRYHGRAGFEQFSHEKGILKASSRIDLPLLYPPYGPKLKWIRKLLK